MFISTYHIHAAYNTYVSRSVSYFGWTVGQALLLRESILITMALFFYPTFILYHKPVFLFRDSHRPLRLASLGGDRFRWVASYFHIVSVRGVLFSFIFFRHHLPVEVFMLADSFMSPSATHVYLTVHCTRYSSTTIHRLGGTLRMHHLSSLLPCASISIAGFGLSIFLSVFGKICWLLVFSVSLGL